MKEWISIILSVIIIVAIMALCGFSDLQLEDYYNHGVHADCGGHWHVVAHYKLSYTYECDTCYATFNSSFLMR